MRLALPLAESVGISKTKVQRAQWFKHESVMLAAAASTPNGDLLPMTAHASEQI